MIKIKQNNLKEIINDINFNVDDVKYKTPTTIIYENR
jgi:hypothetical protein